MQFIYESQAFFASFRNGVGFPFEGMEKMASIAHKYKIPVTWLTNAKGAEAAASRFTEFHEKFGDEVSLWLMPVAKYKKDQYRTVMNWTKDQIREFVREELDRAKKALPWAKWDTCGFFFRTNDVIQVLAELGFIGAYGACWNQYLTDSVDDVGIPYGCYYMDPTNFKRPASTSDAKNLVISNEWLTHDLNKVSNYKKTASIFSTDPNDVNNNGICYPGYNQYWYDFFRQHYLNSQYNAFYPFIFHQESHEMLNTSAFQIYPKERVEETALILDDLLQYVTDPKNNFDVEFTTIPAALRKYKSQYASTPPMISVFDDYDITTPRFTARKAQFLAKLKWDPRKIAAKQGANKTSGLIGGPYPPTLIYYDVDCQLFFHQPQSWPIEIRNYHKSESSAIKNLTRNSEIFKEREIPIPVWTYPSANPTEIQITIGSKPSKVSEFPYGLVIWNPERLFNGQAYTKWNQLIKQISPQMIANPTFNYLEFLNPVFSITGPVDQARICWFTDQNPSAIGGHNAILLKCKLQNSPLNIKIELKK